MSAPLVSRSVAVRGGAVVVLLLGLGWWWSSRASGAGGADWATASRGDLVTEVEVEGTLAAVQTQLMTPPAVSGRWEFKISRMAPDGTDVREGAEVLRFDTSELERRLSEMTATLDSAEKEIEKKQTSIVMRRRDDQLRLAEARAKLQKAELKLERPEEFVAAKEIAALELDRKLAVEEVAYLENRLRLMDEADEVELAILREQRDLAALRVRELETGIERMTLRAPRDGTVVHVTDRRGEKKRVGDTVWRRDRILEIPDLTRMVARGLVDESDAGRLALGQPVELRLDAYPDLTYTGTIERIAKTVQPKTRNSPLRVVRVEIALAGTDQERMRPEMRFRGRIETERREDVLLVPVQAVVQGPAGAAVRQRVLTGTETAAVTLGGRNADMVEIVDGLEAGDEVRLRP